MRCRCHHLNLSWFDDLAAGDHVCIRPLVAIDGHFISGLETVEVAKDFAEYVIVGGQDHVAFLTGIGSPLVLPNSLFQLLPSIALDNRCIDANGGELKSACVVR